VSGYAKLFSSILDSTVWQENKETRLVWVTMLAMKDRRQIVEASVPGLAKRAGVDLKECEDALNRLKSPDPYSRSKENEGRRIKDVDGGWLILNGEKYRDAMSAEVRRAYKAKKQKEYRDRAKIARPTSTNAERVAEQARANGDEHTAERLEKIQAGLPPTLSDELGGPDA
jgi:hypothetical protein